MLIDWFTVGAQALNFLILAWLLKRFLYKPILDAIDVREDSIASKLAGAEAKEAEAQKERDEFKRKNETFDKQRATLLTQATTEANAERRRLLDEARQAAVALLAKRQDALRSEQQSLNDEIGRRTKEEVFAIARKTLTDLANATLEDQMSAAFARRLQGLGEKEKSDLVKVVRASTAPAVVRSAFELPSQQKTAIQQALDDLCSGEIEVNFETMPDLISGIELIANGQKIAWSIGNYLGALEKSIAELLKEQAKPQTKPEFKPELKPESVTESADPEKAQ
ncbi:MAG: F0F1 ATP synthase subunit delta [Burkholderiaceae bacterium]